MPDDDHDFVLNAPILGKYGSSRFAQSMHRESAQPCFIAPFAEAVAEIPQNQQASPKSFFELGLAICLAHSYRRPIIMEQSLVIP